MTTAVAEHTRSDRPLSVRFRLMFRTRNSPNCAGASRRHDSRRRKPSIASEEFLGQRDDDARRASHVCTRSTQGPSTGACFRAPCREALLPTPAPRVDGTA
jgi:hypothetical protein